MEINQHDAGTPAAQPVDGVQHDAPVPSKRPKVRGLVHVIDRSHEPAQRPSRPRRPVQQNSVWTVLAVVAVGLLVVGIVAVGFRGSLGALRDAALAAHIEKDAASLYWIGVDGLIVVAIIAALVMRNDREARNYCLTVVGGFTLASWLLNYLHGLGWFTPDPVSKALPPLPWGVVLVIASLIIGTIFFGTHLLVYVLRHLFPGTAPEQDEEPPAITTATVGEAAAADQSEPSAHRERGVQRTAEEDLAERKKWAAVAYGLALDKGVTIPKVALAEAFQISTRQAGYVRADVELEREERAKREAEVATSRASGLAPAIVAERPSLNGHHPTVPDRADTPA
jgi:hypothetical protein